jgi:hypothetical protein
MTFQVEGAGVEVEVEALGRPRHHLRIGAESTSSLAFFRLSPSGGSSGSNTIAWVAPGPDVVGSSKGQ